MEAYACQSLWFAATVFNRLIFFEDAVADLIKARKGVLS